MYDAVWAVAIVAAVLLDRLGDPPNRFHPTAWMGLLIAILVPVRNVLWWGVVMVVLCVSLVAALMAALWVAVVWIWPDAWSGAAVLYWIVCIPILKSTISVRGMEQHAMSVHSSVLSGDGRAAGRLACIVKRHTVGMTTSQICSGVIESVAENTVDGITGPLFYAGLAGPAGALVHRTVNTVDSMAGYRSEMFRQVGWFGAKCDTMLNWAPARISGLFMVLAAAMCGYDWRGAYHTMRRDARLPDSANSGYTMAAMAGALGIRLEKPLQYTLGDGRDAEPRDIPAAIQIMRCTAWMFTAMAAAMAIAMAAITTQGVVHGGIL